MAQILLDPYFRTIEGFEVLVMKDWVYFGHPFEERMGHGNLFSSSQNIYSQPLKVKEMKKMREYHHYLFNFWIV